MTAIDTSQSELRAGPFSPAFEASFIDALSAVAAKNPFTPQVVLVGSNFLGIHLRHALALKTGRFANVRFLTFVDLAQTLSQQRFQGKGIRAFPEGGEELLLGELCETISEKSMFFDVRSQEGFHKALKTTFHDLLDAGIAELSNRSGKLGELAALYDKHHRRYEAAFATTADVIFAAAKSGSSFREIFGANTLFCYGFYDLTAIQQKLLLSIASSTPIRAWVPADPVDPFFRDLGGTVRKVEPDSKPNVHALSAPEPSDEAEEVVRWILQRLEQHQIPLHRIGILLRNPEEYLPLFCQVLDRAGVSYYREGGVPLLTTRHGQAFSLFLEVWKGKWTRTELIHLLSIFPFDAAQLEKTDMESPAEWDLWTREAQVVAGDENLFSRLTGYQKRLNGTEAHHADQVKRFIQFLRGWFKTWEKIRGDSTSWGAFGSALAEWFSEWAEKSSATDTIVHLCRSLVDLDDLGVTPTPSQIQKILGKRMDSATVPTGKVFERDGLYVGSLVSARAISFDLVCIPGLAQRSFPAPPKPDPILLDSERQEINRATSGRLPLREHRLAEERLLFDMAFHQSGREILLSYPRFSSGDQRERFPSSFFIRSTEKEDVKINQRPLLRWNHEKARPFLDVRDWMAREVGHQILAKDETALAGLASWTPLAEPIQRWVKERLGERHWTTFDGIVKLGPNSLALNKAFSASEISTYATCPYRYYLKHVLRLQSLERPDDVKQLRPLDRGNIIHEILFRLFTELREKNLLPLKLTDRPTIEARLLSIAEEVFEGVEEKLPTGPQMLWRSERNLILSDLRAFLRIEFDEAAIYEPYAFEVRFGRPAMSEQEDRLLSTEAPVLVSLGNKEKIALQGKIDRIDLSHDKKRARIIDYKTSSLKKNREDSFDGGRAIQLPVYLSALPTLLPNVSLEASEAVLWSTSYGGGFKRIRFTGETLAAREREFRQILSSVVKGSQGGYFPPNPGKNLENCTYCDFRAICGRAVGRVYERKRDDPALKFVFDLEEIE